MSLDVSYTGKEFIADGIGEVTLSHCTDGDTATFTTGGQDIALRFLGIDTPESTYRFDPWGKAASAYTCDKLENATTLVLQADGDRTDGNGRYLGWVWYDGRLLNLELVEQAYSSSKSATGLIYSSDLYAAELYAQQTKLRVWGEVDPDFDYSLDGVQITIEELNANPMDYYQRKVVIHGIITSTVEGHPYIQQGDFGVYLYRGYELTTKLEIGNEVRLSALTVTFFPDVETGSLQLSNVDRSNIELISTGNVVEPQVFTIDELTMMNVGALVKVENLTVQSDYYDEVKGDFTITFVDESSQVIKLRSENTIDLDDAKDLFVVGDVMSIVGPVALYNGAYQILLQSLETVELVD